MSVYAGARGATVGRLNPAGEVVVDGVRHPARAEFGMLDPATPIVVVGSNEFGLLVRPAGNEDPAIDPDEVHTTPVEKVEQRADQTLVQLEQAREELRGYLLILLALPVLCGAIFAGIGYVAGGETWAAVGLVAGLGIGVVGMLKLWLAS